VSVSQGQDASIRSGTTGRKVLLIGATGLCGGAVGARLVEKGWSVRAFLRSGRNPLDLVFRTDEIVFGGLLSQADLQAAMEGVDAVLYFASTSVPATSAKDPTIEFETSLVALNNTLLAMTRAGVRRILFPSSGGTIYGPVQEQVAETTPLAPTSGYGLGKLLAEEMIKFYARAHGLTYTVMRLTNVYGSAKRRMSPQGVVDVFLDDALNGRTSQIWGSLEIERDYLFVDDMADAVFAALNADKAANEVFNVGASSSVKLAQIVDQIGAVTNGRHAYQIDASKPSGVLRSAVDCSHIRSTIGWTPKYSLAEGIELTWRRKIAQLPAT
jgi:UDP-glucose 4-epimerase